MTADLNDDALGRFLDELYKNDCTKIFSHIALNDAKIHRADKTFRYLDTTNMQVHGSYESQDESMQIGSYGYPKQLRADLKQW